MPVDDSEYEQAEDEIERLRKALEYYATGIVERGDIARAALGMDKK